MTIRQKREGGGREGTERERGGGGEVEVEV